MSYPFNFEDYIMENIAVYDALKREGFAESVIDRVERAVNSHNELVELLSISLDYEQFNANGRKVFKERARQAIEQAEGEK